MFLGDVTAFTWIGLQIEQTWARLIAAIASLLYCGHTGRDSGVSTQMFFQVQNGVGVIVLTNGDVDEGTNAEKALLAIEARLFEEAAHL